MNPEFLRNIWLELTPRRIGFMIVVLALIFFAAAVSGGSDYRPAAVAVALYYFIVVFWGTRNAALSVVGEIRNRTWDWQRLSAQGPAAMTWGKLFGSTIYNWFGGGICLLVILVSRFVHQGLLPTLVDLVYFIALGVISQSAALLASLIAARRRHGHSRLEVFLYQTIGLAAAVCVFVVWEAADPAGSFLARTKPADLIAWWGYVFDARPFLLISLAIFAGWTLAGAYREMRRELRMRNGPYVWILFLAFIGLYVAGFDAWKTAHIAGWDAISARLLLASFVYTVLTYATVLLEPKDRVLYRQIGSDVVGGRLGRAFLLLQTWMFSFAAASAVAVALVLHVWQTDSQNLEKIAALVSALGFFSRDIFLFVLFQSLPGRRRGDFGTVIALFTLYAIVPAILSGLDLGKAQFLFYPKPADPLWLGPAAAWTEALVIIGLTVSRLARQETPAGEPAVA